MEADAVKRTLEEIMANAENLADQFEQMAVDSEDFRDARPLGRIRQAVQDALDAGLSWESIMAYVGEKP